MIENIYALFTKHNFLVSTDTRNILPNSIFFALKGNNFDANIFANKALENGASYAVIDNEKYQTNDHIILVDDVLKTLQTLAAYHRKQLNIPIIAITGSNGKTTTKELINTVLSKKYKTTATKGNLNNHIGVPLTLLSMSNDTEIGIVEMGANHPKEIEFLCKIAIPDYGYITNFGKAHLEGFGSINGVIKAKTELYHFLKTHHKTVFVNTQDNIQVEQSKDLKQIPFGIEGLLIKMIEANPYVHVSCNGTRIKSHLIGDYNYNNIAASIAIGRYFEVDLLDIKSAIEHYKPTNNRSQIMTVGRSKIILDAYNANPTSMLFALQNFTKLSDRSKIAILGDMFELGEYSEIEHQNITDFVSQSPLDMVYLIGSHFSKSTTTNNNVRLFKNYTDFEAHFSKTTIDNTTILIKGSRGMKLERIISTIQHMQTT